MDQLPQGVITFLMTDIVGSTALWEREADQMPTAMTRHDEIIEQAVADNRGFVVRPRGEGDSRFAVFVHPADALAAAVELQRGLGAGEWPTATPIRVRAAVHTGFAGFERGDYYGSAVNRTARIRSLGHGGQTLVSLATYEAVKDTPLPDGVTLHDLGEHELEGLTRSERVFQIEAAGLVSDFPPLASTQAAPTEAPRESGRAISVFLADDNLLIREGVKSLIELAGDFDVVGTGADFDELVEGSEALEPQVVVTDIRMPPSFEREGIEAAKLIRKRNPGTGVVILSQYDDPEYAISLLADGAAGFAYLLKDRIAEGDQLVRAIREVATGGSVLDPRIVEALTRPVQTDGHLTDEEEALLGEVAAGTPIKAIAVALNTTASDVDARIDRLFHKLGEQVSAGSAAALERIKRLHRAIIEREEQGEALSRLLPVGMAESLLGQGHRIGETESRDLTVLASDVRGYSIIAERSDPTALAGQLDRHRAAMDRAIGDHGGMVMQFSGDSVIAVFGAPTPIEGHAAAAMDAAAAMHAAQAEVDAAWEDDGLDPFHLGIALSSGTVEASLLGSEDRVEYSLVGAAIDLAQRLQEWAGPGEVVLSEATVELLDDPPAGLAPIEPASVEGQQPTVQAYRVSASERA